MGRCEKLKWNRRKLGMTQEELAKKVGVSKATICKLENDETAWATIKDSTDDALYDTLRSLGTWNCNINSVFKDSPTDDDIRDVRKKVREKRLEMGMSQRDLAVMLGIDSTTICHYEKHDKYWKQKKSSIVHKLVSFVEGKYDVESVDGDGGNNKVEEVILPDTEKITSTNKPVDAVTEVYKDMVKANVRPDITTDVIGMINVKESYAALDDATTKAELEPVEDTLNNLIDILQDRMKKAAGAGKKTDVYVHMIAGLCEEYLRCVE